MLDGGKGKAVEKKDPPHIIIHPHPRINTPQLPPPPRPLIPRIITPKHPIPTLDKPLPLPPFSIFRVVEEVDINRRSGGY